MSPAPIPPHERQWRHPSELAPTKADVEPDAHRFTLPLIVGSATMLVIAVLVVAVTPSPTGTEEIALTGSTTPARITQRTTLVPVANSSAATIATAPTGGRGVAPDNAAVRLAAFTAIPNAIAATPTFDIDERRHATRLPRADEHVLVQTEWATYRITWRQMQWLELDGPAMIADETHAVVGYIENGSFYPLFDR